MPFHAKAFLSGGSQKILINKEEAEMMSEIVVPFVATGVVTALWGKNRQSYQVLDLQIYQTTSTWGPRTGAFDDAIRGKRNLARRFIEQAKTLLAKDKPRVFFVTPIQGSRHGDMEQQRILREFDERFAIVERVIELNGGIAIRIDREQPLEDLVSRIKTEIRQSLFLITDLTDERQSCYFEAGSGEALGKPIIYIASPNSVMKPGTKTTIHFDIHKNILFFTNREELRDRLTKVIERNRAKLFPHDTEDRIGVQVG